MSLKFAPNSTDTLNGYVVGGTYRVGKYLDFLVGYALTPFQEPTPAFQKIAIQTVQENPNVAAYKIFDPNKLATNIPNAYDGFPILKQTGVQGQSSTLYSGDPLSTRYHGGFLIGIAFPLELNLKPAKR